MGVHALVSGLKDMEPRGYEQGGNRAWLGACGRSTASTAGCESRRLCQLPGQKQQILCGLTCRKKTCVECKPGCHAPKGDSEILDRQCKGEIQGEITSGVLASGMGKREDRGRCPTHLYDGGQACELQHHATHALVA